MLTMKRFPLLYIKYLLHTDFKSANLKGTCMANPTSMRLLTASLLLIFSVSTAGAAVSDNLKADAFVKQPEAVKIKPEVKSYLLAKESEKVKVWIFFTDKGVFDKSGFEQKAATINISEKVMNRRAKVNSAEVLFADLPVEKTYVEQITNLGATHRRSSKWLNAASFEMTIEQMESTSSFPFAASVRPMVGFKKEVEIAPDIIDIEPTPDQSYKSPDALNYGSSFTQLNQINVPAVHNKGYTGAGVTLCLTDTGYRKSHEAFAAAYSGGRVLDEYDFVFDDNNTANEIDDWSSQWNHGTLIWSVSAGQLDGTMYGPAYNANILLAKTEDVRSETQVEEDNWVAALEWADSLGADVISTSLGYSDWYTSSDYDGATATITLAANTCASLGIVLCNSMGNSGPGPLSLSPPADAFNILAVGNVNSSGTISSSSSRGPTFDGRTKPEVCAMGSSTFSASSSGDQNYTTASGTSLSTPLVAGAACLLIEARPTFPPALIRLALMETADNAATPDNNYGWGILDVDAALSWGVTIDQDVQVGEAPLAVNFTGTSGLTVTSWEWDFGDGNMSTDQNPTHVYTNPGSYDVTLTIDTEYGLITDTRTGQISALGDTLTFATDSAFAGQQAVMSVNLTNSQPLSQIQVPIVHTGAPLLKFDSAHAGSRTSYFEQVTPVGWDSFNSRYTYRLTADNGGGAPDLAPGSGEVLKLFFTINEDVLGGNLYPVDTTDFQFPVLMTSPYLAYTPKFEQGNVKVTDVLRGDLTYDFGIDISDLVYMVSFSFGGGPAPLAKQMYDVNADLTLDIADITYLVAFMFSGGPPPVSP
ncbi:MAG: PKD domain-containing protein [Calditrichaeota bacterium]|nr:MAG: PKD domain-containing protein [Calditrichota bacterium]